jgi:hypothetical protein
VYWDVFLRFQKFCERISSRTQNKPEPNGYSNLTPNIKCWIWTVWKEKRSHGYKNKWDYLTESRTKQMKITVFWYMMPCNLVEIYRRYAFCLILTGWRWRRRQDIAPKRRWTSIGLYDFTSQKVVLVIATAGRTSNPPYCEVVVCSSNFTCAWWVGWLHGSLCCEWLFIHSSMAVQPFVGPWSLLQFHNLFLYRR